MHLFTVNHEAGGFYDPCKCSIREKNGVPGAGNKINLDNLTEVSWEDGMWLVYFGETYYRVHDEEVMARLETALSLTRPE